MRGPRYLPEPSLVEITVRTAQSRFLLRPCKVVNDTVVGVVARAKRRYEVDVIDVKAMSSHLHVIGFFRDVRAMARFMRYVNSNIARKVGRLIGWRGPFWERRYSHVVIANEEVVQVARLEYLLRNGCKEGLVARPQDWPGATGVHAMLEGSMTMEGAWLDLSGLYRARLRGERPSKRKFVKRETLELSKLPCWKDLPDEEYRARIREIVTTITQETRAMHAAAGTKPVGAKKLRQLGPNHCAAHPARSPKPLIHAACQETRRRFREGWRLFVEAYCAAAKRLKAGDREVEFPEGCYPPGLPFVPLGTGPPG
jgi:hypothetical protein